MPLLWIVTRKKFYISKCIIMLSSSSTPGTCLKITPFCPWSKYILNVAFSATNLCKICKSPEFFELRKMERVPKSFLCYLIFHFSTSQRKLSQSLHDSRCYFRRKERCEKFGSLSRILISYISALPYQGKVISFKSNLTFCQRDCLPVTKAVSLQM